jgi:peptidoglycan/LPS O-acetylase OafA/YrhL
MTPAGSIAATLLGGGIIAVGFYASILSKGTAWLASNTFRMLGHSAYAFYLLHLGPLASAIQWSAHYQGITYIVCWVFSFAIFSFVERPLLQSLYKRIRII